MNTSELKEQETIIALMVITRTGSCGPRNLVNLPAYLKNAIDQFNAQSLGEILSERI